MLFFLVLCYTRDVADLSELTVARNAQSPCVCARDTSVRCVQGSSQFAFRYFLVEPDVSPHLNPNRTDCVRVQRSVISIVNCLVRDSSSFVTSPRVIVNHTPSARVIIVFDNCLYYLHLIIFIKNKRERKELRKHWSKANLCFTHCNVVQVARLVFCEAMNPTLHCKMKAKRL